jgi:hypothetical protein
LATLAGSETFTNKTLTSPRIGTSVLDTNGNEFFLLTATGSAVNELTYANAATGNSPTFTASGTNSDVGLNLTMKGTGELSVTGPLNITGTAAGSANPVEVFESGDGTARTTVSPDGKLKTRAGNGATPATSFITLGGLYHRDTTAVGNVGAGTDDLISKSVEANVFGEDGDTMYVLMSGTASAQDGGAGDTRTIVWSLGGQTIDTRVINATNATCRWRVELHMVRTAATTIFYVSKWEAWNTGSDTAPLRSFQVSGTITVTLSNSNTLKATGASSDAVNNDIVQDALLVWKYSTP